MCPITHQVSLAPAELCLCLLAHWTLVCAVLTGRGIAWIIAQTLTLEDLQPDDDLRKRSAHAVTLALLSTPPTFAQITLIYIYVFSVSVQNYAPSHSKQVPCPSEGPTCRGGRPLRLLSQHRDFADATATCVCPVRDDMSLAGRTHRMSKECRWSCAQIGID